RRGHKHTRLGIAIGDKVLDVGAAFQIPSMEALMALPQSLRVDLRRQASALLSKFSPGAERFLTPLADVDLLLPCNIPDYTDFYASFHHATNVGSLFRPDQPLLHTH